MMNHSKRYTKWLLLGLTLLALPTLKTWAEELDLPAPMLTPLNIPAPATAPATAPTPPTATQPATEAAPATAPVIPTAPVATAPSTTQSAEDVMAQLLNPVTTTTTNPAVTALQTAIPGVPGVAPVQPAVVRLHEGDTIVKRVGRLIKDEKSQQWFFAFESDGKEMKDPPIGLIPSTYLAMMENLSGNGTKSVKFIISGEVTEYRGKNYLYVKFVQIVRDMNQF